MKSSIREALADSHIAAIAIAILLLWSLSYAFQVLWLPLSPLIIFLATAVAIVDVPFFSRGLDAGDRLTLITMLLYLYTALAGLGAACMLSRWVYGEWPLRCLITHCNHLTGSKNA
jgi:hypothetical protein